jgi:hypothetical protein
MSTRVISVYVDMVIYIELCQRECYIEGALTACVHI